MKRPGCKETWPLAVTECSEFWPRPVAARLKAEAAGFATSAVKAVEVGVDQARTLDLVLRVGAKTEVIEVQADAALTQTETSHLGEIIDNRKVEGPAVEWSRLRAIGAA